MSELYFKIKIPYRKDLIPLVQWFINTVPSVIDEYDTKGMEIEYRYDISENLELIPYE